MLFTDTEFFNVNAIEAHFNISELNKPATYGGNQWPYIKSMSMINKLKELPSNDFQHEYIERVRTKYINEPIDLIFTATSDDDPDDKGTISSRNFNQLTVDETIKKVTFTAKDREFVLTHLFRLIKENTSIKTIEAFFDPTEVANEQDCDTVYTLIKRLYKNGRFVDVVLTHLHGITFSKSSKDVMTRIFANDTMVSNMTGFYLSMCEIVGSHDLVYFDELFDSSRLKSIKQFGLDDSKSDIPHLMERIVSRLRVDQLTKVILKFLPYNATMSILNILKKASSLTHLNFAYAIISDDGGDVESLQDMDDLFKTFNALLNDNNVRDLQWLHVNVSTSIDPNSDYFFLTEFWSVLARNQLHLQHVSLYNSYADIIGNPEEENESVNDRLASSFDALVHFIETSPEIASINAGNIGQLLNNPTTYLDKYLDLCTAIVNKQSLVHFSRESLESMPLRYQQFNRHQIFPTTAAQRNMQKSYTHWYSFVVSALEAHNTTSYDLKYLLWKLIKDDPSFERYIVAENRPLKRVMKMPDYVRREDVMRGTRRVYAPDTPSSSMVNPFITVGGDPLFQFDDQGELITNGTVSDDDPFTTVDASIHIMDIIKNHTNAPPSEYDNLHRIASNIVTQNAPVFNSFVGVPFSRKVKKAKAAAKKRIKSTKTAVSKKTKALKTKAKTTQAAAVKKFKKVKTTFSKPKASSKPATSVSTTPKQKKTKPAISTSTSGAKPMDAAPKHDNTKPIPAVPKQKKSKTQPGTAVSKPVAATHSSENGHSTASSHTKPETPEQVTSPKKAKKARDEGYERHLERKTKNQAAKIDKLKAQNKQHRKELKENLRSKRQQMDAKTKSGTLPTNADVQNVSVAEMALAKSKAAHDASVLEMETKQQQSLMNLKQRYEPQPIPLVVPVVIPQQQQQMFASPQAAIIPANSANLNVISPSTNINAFTTPPVYQVVGNDQSAREAILTQLDYKPPVVLKAAAQFMTQQQLEELKAARISYDAILQQYGADFKNPIVVNAQAAYNTKMNNISQAIFGDTAIYAAVSASGAFGNDQEAIRRFVRHVRNTPKTSIAFLTAIKNQDRAKVLKLINERKDTKKYQSQPIYSRIGTKTRLYTVDEWDERNVRKLTKYLAPIKYPHSKYDIIEAWRQYLYHFKQIEQLDNLRQYETLGDVPYYDDLVKDLWHLFTAISSRSRQGCSFPLSFYILLVQYTEAHFLNKIGYEGMAKEEQLLDNTIFTYLRAIKGEDVADAWLERDYFGNQLANYLYHTQQSHTSSCYGKEDANREIGFGIYLRLQDGNNYAQVKIRESGQVEVMDGTDITNNNIYDLSQGVRLELERTKLLAFAQKVYKATDFYGVTKLVPDLRSKSTRLIEASDGMIISDAMTPAADDNNWADVWNDFNMIINTIPRRLVTLNDHPRPLSSSD